MQFLQSGGILRFSTVDTSPDVLPLNFKRLVAAMVIIIILGWNGLLISGKLINIIDMMVDFTFNYKKKNRNCLTCNIVVSEQRQVDIGHSVKIV